MVKTMLQMQQGEALRLIRYFVGFCLIVVGFILMGGGARIAGGDLGTASKVEGLLVSTLGLELVVGSYAIVRRLPFERLYRTAIYLILLLACVPLIVAVVQTARFGFPPINPEAQFRKFQLAIGGLGCANLAVFLRWAGLAEAPPSRTKARVK
jgi:hypothetical protein